MVSATAYDEYVEQLFDVLARVTALLRQTGVEYRVVGGLSVFLHIAGKDPIRARGTRDIDIAVARADLGRIAGAAPSFGFRFRHAAGVDMLLDRERPREKSPVHFLFVREKVHPEDEVEVPDFSAPAVTPQGVLLAPVADVLRMKLTSFRLRDKVHIQDLDGVGLITPEMEGGLPEGLRVRLAEVRATR